MSVLESVCRKCESYAEKRVFGDFGEFEIADFHVTFTVDPKHPANSRIVDLIRAAFDEKGHVRFDGNARLIYPKNRTPSCLLVDVPNRGRPTVFSFNRPMFSELQKTSTPSGDGFLFRHGFAVLSIGWQFDAEGMTLNVPEAISENQPIKGDAICQMQPSRDTNSLIVGQGGVLTYVPTGKGRLFQCANTQLPYGEIDAGQWRFGRTRDGEFDPSPKYISKDGGFSKGFVYTLVYETVGAPIVGLGLLALRDASAWFKHSFTWPKAPPPYTIGYGASQTGRVLRHFLYEGLNEDENESQIFDAVIPHMAGGQRGDFNHRFAQPGSMGVPAAGQQFPFSTVATTDALTKTTQSLLDRCNNPPKILNTNTSWEYWRGDAALIHVSTDGQSDLPVGPNERTYLFAGTHHIDGVLPLSNQFALGGEQLPYPLNTISYTPLLRAVLANALAWLRDDVEPPPSRYPRLSDESLVDRAEVIAKFKQSPYFPHLPDAASLTALWSLDLGDDIEDGICRFPARLRARYPTLVTDVNDHLNEVAGIRLPEVAIPIGIHSGWNPRDSVHGAANQTAAFAGFSVFDNLATIPYPREECQLKAERVADELIADRYVLAEDRELVICNAMQRFDVAVEVTTAKRQE